MHTSNIKLKNKKEGNLIAVVIPFFKLKYLENILNALSNQSDRRFNLYIGNDNSKEDPLPIISKFHGLLSIKYHHYAENLGHICPTKQWNRCLNLIKNEEWIWVLPDDDLISENCISEFYRSLHELEEAKINVATIPSREIDSDGKFHSNVNINPKLQTVYEFYLRQLKGEATGSTLGDNIFRRSALLSSGGFVSFPRAWGSDHATILNVAANGHVYCLQNAWFGFRQSGINISSIRTDGVEKLKARIQFLKWIKHNKNIFDTPPDEDFYKFFYWKGEHYVLNEWENNIHLYFILFKLRCNSINSYNPLPIIKIFLTKLTS